jgi:SNF2 family DNA or RNA helicase
MLALDCGLGKTHVGIAYMLLHLPAVVVCPASLIASWHEHILAFAPSALSQITIQSYNKMVLVPGTQCVVADEAHYLKHEGSQRSQAFMRLLVHQPRVLLLTGTPAQRNMDLFHLLKILCPDQITHFFHYGHAKVPGRWYFAERYTVPVPVWIGGARHGFKFTTNRHSEELALLGEHVILRMKKNDVVQLPDLTVTAVSVGSTDDPVYFAKRWREIDEVRQTCGNRKADSELLALCRETAQAKLPLVTAYLLSWLHTHPTAKVIVFYHHQDIGTDLATTLDHHQFGYVRIDGKTPMRTRVQRLQTFRTDTMCRVGVLSMCATSTGLNLQFCTKILFVELTFLSVHHTQAEARIHRIGQDQPVSVDYLVLDGTTDTLLWQSLQSKRRAEEILFDSGGENTPLEPI